MPRVPLSATHRKKTAQGVKRFAPVNNVESRFRWNKQVNNNLPTGSIAAAVDLLNKENVIAYPTEAVFGVGCDPDSETAVTRLLALKQRPVDKGLILIAASFEQLKPYIDDTILTVAQRKAVFDCWPGPVTFVFLRPRQRRGGSRDVLIPRPFVLPTTRWWSRYAMRMANRWFPPAPI